jgi:hypothetical protein
MCIIKQNQNLWTLLICMWERYYPALTPFTDHFTTIFYSIYNFPWKSIIWLFSPTLAIVSALSNVLIHIKNLLRKLISLSYFVSLSIIFPLPDYLCSQNHLRLVSEKPCHILYQQTLMEPHIVQSSV